jgi:hypothetical protein
MPEVREALASARKLLLEPSPQNIALCRAPLAAAIEGVERIANLLREGGQGGAPTSAFEICAEVSRISELLDRAASFHAGLLCSMIAASAPGTDPGGRTFAHLQVDA